MDILEQAILDAKSIREAAVNNAKSVLDESWKPTLQRMISSRLEEEGDEDDIDMGADDMAPEVPPAAPAADVPPVAPDAPPVAPQAPQEQRPEDDLDLDSLLAELDAIDGGSHEEEQPTDTFEATEPIVAEGDGYDKKTSTAHKNLKETELPVTEGEGDDEEKEDDKDEDDVNLDELFQEVFGKKIKAAAKAASPSATMIAENKTLKTENVKLKQALTIMKKAVNDTMLLNSRLFFANKLNKHFTLTEGQKDKMLQAFDRASNIRECQLVYTSLAQNLAESKNTAKANSTSTNKKAIVESMSRRGVVSPNASDFKLKERWGVLSGLKPLQD